MSTIKTNTILDASGGSTTTINGVTPNAYNTMGKNRIINGAMEIDQRNAGASVTPTASNTLVLDRFVHYLSQSSKFSVQQSSTAPAGFKNSMLITSLSSYAVGVSDYFLIQHRVEGLNCADLSWGSSDAKTITLSFWVRSSLTGTFSGAIGNSANTRTYAYTYTINSADTWEQKTITIAGDTSGTWLTTNGIGLVIGWSLGTGTNQNTTAGSWTAGNYNGATGTTSVVGTNAATFYITGVQLEVGSVATEFERRPYTTELQLCQRYYEVINSNVNQTFWADIASGINNVCAVANLFYRVTKRATPTVAQYGSYVTVNVNTPSIHASVDNCSLYYQVTSSARCYWYPNANAGITISAEL